MWLRSFKKILSDRVDFFRLNEACKKTADDASVMGSRYRTGRTTRGAADTGLRTPGGRRRAWGSLIHRTLQHAIAPIRWRLDSGALSHVAGFPVCTASRCARSSAMCASPYPKSLPAMQPTVGYFFVSLSYLPSVQGGGGGRARA